MCLSTKAPTRGSQRTSTILTIRNITAATSGSISNFANGFVDLHMALLVTVAELVGVVAGAKLAHSVSSGVLKKMVSVVCIIVGAFIFVRALLQA